MVPVYVHSLSSLEPINFGYNFAGNDYFKSNSMVYKSGFNYHTHEAFNNFKDIVLSNKTCLILTDNISLSRVFANKFRKLDLNEISGSFYLKTKDGTYVRTKNNRIYVGDVGQKLILTIDKISSNEVELKSSASHNLTVSEKYPFELFITKEKTEEGDYRRQLFEIDFQGNKISIKTITNHGPRYISYNSDQIVRAVGLELNNLEINPYLFTIELISETIGYNYNAVSSRVNYFNDIKFTNNSTDVQIKSNKEVTNHMVITCPTKQLGKSTTASANILVTKTNYFPSGSYNNTL